MAKHSPLIHLSARKTLVGLLVVLAVLVVLHIVGQYLWHIQGLTNLSLYVDRFNMNEENSFPTWFATILLIISSILLWIIGAIKISTEDTFTKYWKILAVIFLILSIDEGSSMHEMLSVSIGATLGIQGGMFYYAWVIPALLLLAVLALYFFKFWQNLYSSTRWLVFWAGLLYISGALGIEMLGGRYATKLGGYDFNYFLLVAVEEGLEKMGLVVFIYALIKCLARLKDGVWIGFRD